MNIPPTLFIGTCRVHEPAGYLHTRGEPARITQHRVHSPEQALQKIRFLTGEETYSPMSIHTLSDRAFERVVAGQRDAAFDQFTQCRELWRWADVIVLEICTLVETVAEMEGKRLIVNPFARRDLLAHAEFVERGIQAGELIPLRADQVRLESSGERDPLPILRSIRALMGGKRLIWVPHVNIPDTDPRFERVHQQRGAVRDTLSQVAREFGDELLDPAEVVAAWGRIKIFEKEGEDLTHYTPFGIQSVAREFLDRLRGDKRQLAPVGF